jgi:hypothetical protein
MGHSKRQKLEPAAPGRKKIEKLAYMHMNPVKRGLVARPDHWLRSSCKFYEGQKETFIRVDPVE